MSFSERFRLLFFSVLLLDTPLLFWQMRCRAEVEVTETVTQGRSGGAKGKTDFWKKSVGMRPLISKTSGFGCSRFCMSNFHYQNFNGGLGNGALETKPLQSTC